MSLLSIQPHFVFLIRQIDRQRRRQSGNPKTNVLVGHSTTPGVSIETDRQTDTQTVRKTNVLVSHSTFPGDKLGGEAKIHNRPDSGNWLLNYRRAKGKTPKTGGSNDWEETNDKIGDNIAKNR